MSGPKSATYYLTAAQIAALAKQRELELQRKREQEKIRTERAKIETEKSSVKPLLGIFETEIAEANELFRRTGAAADFESKVKALEKTILELSNTAVPQSAGIDKLKQINATIRAKIAEIKTDIQKLKDTANENRKQLVSDLDETISKGYSFDINELLFSEETLKEEISTKELSAKIISALSEYENPDFLTDDTRANIKGAIAYVKTIEDNGHLKNYAAITVLPLLKKCEKEKAETESCKPEYEDLMVQYKALCEYAKRQPETVKCTFAGIAFLKEQIAVISAQIAKSDEESYIASAFDEVMAEMGYDILGYRNATRHGASFRHDLYRYSDGTAIDVTFSSDGKIAMELGGLDKVDRTPDADEAESLCREMESFCSDYAEIERRLAEKGVIMGKRLSMLPPSVSYAQIINANDYELKKTVEKFTAKKERRTATKKQADRKDI